MSKKLAKYKIAVWFWSQSKRQIEGNLRESTVRLGHYKDQDFNYVWLMYTITL